MRMLTINKPFCVHIHGRCLELDCPKGLHTENSICCEHLSFKCKVQDWKKQTGLSLKPKCEIKSIRWCCWLFSGPHLPGQRQPCLQCLGKGRGGGHRSLKVSSPSPSQFHCSLLLPLPKTQCSQQTWAPYITRVS